MSMNVQKNQILAPYTSLGVGGLAEELVIINSHEGMVDALKTAERRPWLLGFGCNVLISDNGLPGRTLIWRNGEVTISQTEAIADAGVWWDDVVKAAIDANLWGLELTSEIPSSVGGAVFGNIAAYGQQISDTLSWVEVFDFSTKEIIRLDKSDIEFSYRHSSLQNQPDSIILRACFRLSHTPLHELRYDSALGISKAWGLNPDTLENCRKIIIETRRQAGSLYHPKDEKAEHTAGSFFKNPIVSTEQAKELAKFDESGKTLERIENQSRIHGGDSHRASAAHVLLAAGFKRGQAWDKVRLHPQHVLKIETLPGATASEVHAVVEEILKAVKSRLDIKLEPEVKFLGQF